MIRQSAHGAWGIRDYSTTKPTEPMYFQSFFILLGKIARLFSLDPLVMYYVAQIVAGICLFAASYWFIKAVFPESMRILGILFTLGVETGPYLGHIFENRAFLDWSPSFEVQHNLIDRHFGLPHHTMAEAIGLIALGVLWKTRDNANAKHLGLLFILGFLGTIILPPYYITLALALLIPWAVWAVTSKSWRQLIPFFALGAGIGIAGFLLRWEIGRHALTLNFSAIEKDWWTNKDTTLRYVSSLLPFFPFFALLIGTALIWWRSWNKDTKQLVFLMSSWVILPGILIQISNQSWFPIANARLVDGYEYVPAGILATIGVHYFLRGIKKEKLRRRLITAILAALLVVSSALTIRYLKETETKQGLFWVNTYPYTDLWEGIQFLRTLPPGGVMSREHVGVLVPAYTDHSVFIGESFSQPDWVNRLWISRYFFDGETMTEEKARDVLRDNRISYVFYGAEERALTKASSFYPNILLPLFHHGDVTIFRLRPE